ncbi:MAG: FTR1 family iron permease [Acetobacteraceae bacterium]|nr:FTR1 family iron permease [Acetobacteraceae bacterium]
MLIAFLIMLREGIEAALIVGIVASYLRQTGRQSLLPAVWGGVVLACMICLGIGIGLDTVSAEFPQKQQEAFEGLVALIAVGMLTSMVFWMRKAARSIKAQLQHAVDAALRPGDGAGFALVAMVFLAVGREGLESVFFLLATFQQGVGLAVPAGAILGLIGAAGVGAAIYLGGVRLDLRQFFRWTGVFIVLVAAGLCASALRAFHEAGLWNGLQETLFDFSHVLPTDSPVGAVLAGLLGYNDTPTLGEGIVYLAYLIPCLLLFAFDRPRAASVSTA